VTTQTPANPRRPLEAVRRGGMAAWAVLGMLALAAAVVWGVGQVRIVVTPIILGGILVLLLNPVVSWLEERRVPRGVGAVLTYLALVGVVTLGVWLAAPFVAEQFRALASEFPRISAAVLDWLRTTSSRASWLAWLHPDRLREMFGDVGSGGGLSENFGTFVDVGGSALRVVVELVLTPFLALYVLVDLPKLQEVGKGLIPPRARDETLFLLNGSIRIMKNFFRGQLAVAFIVAVLSVVGYSIVGVPFAVAVGVLAGLFNIIPYVGPWIGGILAVLLSLVLANPVTALLAVGVAVGVQQLDNHFVSPMVMKRAVQVHPAAVVLGLLAGGEIAGFWGLLLAVPTIATFKLVTGHFWRTRVLDNPVEVTEEAELSEERRSSRLFSDQRDGAAEDGGEHPQ